MIRSRFEPLLLDTPTGRLFLLLRAPRSASRCVLFVPPFGEEMNKCRRQVTHTAEALNSAGYAVLTIDLVGTGDSSGEFADAQWAAWRSNVASAIAWAVGENLNLHAIVAIRLGCMLAAEGLQKSEHRVARTVFWQPVDSGRQFMTQFLRLRVAASMMADEKETVEELKARLQRGETVEVAGYPLNGELWHDIQQRELGLGVDGRLGKLALFEVRRAGDLSIPVRRLLEVATERGVSASGFCINGEPFWTSTEIVANPELARQTAGFLAELDG